MQNSSGYRMRAILGAPGCPIIGFDQDLWVTALHYDKRNLGKSFEQYRALREANLALLKTLTPPSSGSTMGCITKGASRASKQSYKCLRDTISITPAD
jgi:hypothetical protein